jgi:hypothetical protein
MSHRARLEAELSVPSEFSNNLAGAHDSNVRPHTRAGLENALVTGQECVAARTHGIRHEDAIMSGGEARQQTSGDVTDPLLLRSTSAAPGSIVRDIASGSFRTAVLRWACLSDGSGLPPSSSR